jgi:pyrimidine deaminase RibD-like protein
MNDQEHEFMMAAVDAARKSRDDLSGSVPRVGAVAVLDNEIIGVSYRGQHPEHENDHAEFNLLEKELGTRALLKATIYTTLEPCTERGLTKEGIRKIPCAERLISRKVARVVIGMLDPNPIVRGVGFRALRKANIRTDVFPSDFMAEIEDLNRNFTRAIEENEVHQMTQEIAVLAVRAREKRHHAAARHTLSCCLGDLRRINEGELPINGLEADYFQHWLQRAATFQAREDVRAFIRLSAFKGEALQTRNWYEEYYTRLAELVQAGKLTIRYIYLLGEDGLTELSKAYLDRIKTFAEEIRLVYPSDPRFGHDDLRPSIVLFERNAFAFTHDRADNAAMLRASEWISPYHFARLKKQYEKIELLSAVYFRKAIPN